MNCLLFGLGLGLVLVYPLLIGLRALRMDQQVREDGPESHYKKTGTPTMGGIIFLLAATAATFICGAIDNQILWGIYALWAFGFVGFIDDIIKIFNRSPFGLSGRWTIVLQVLAAAPFLVMHYGNLPHAFGSSAPEWLNLMFSIFIIVGTVNAVNLADGLDGLAAGTGAITLLLLVPIVWAATPSATIVPMATAGALLAFLVVNFKPAKVWMGNLGSNALGGLIAITAIYGGHIWLFALGAGLFVIEALSVIIQVGWFKYTKYLTRERVGKRVFLMSPIHHHFELLGWSEVKIVVVFWSVAAVLGGLMLGLFYLL